MLSRLSVVGALLAALFCMAQMPLAGFPPGTFSNKAALDPVISSGGMTTPIIGLGNGGSNAAPSTSVANSFPLIGGYAPSSSLGSSTLYLRDSPISVPGTIQNLYVHFPSGIGSGNWSVGLTQNGALTSLQCEVVSGTSCSDSSDSVTISADDVIGWETCPGVFSAGSCSPGTAPTANNNFHVSATFTGSNSNESFISGGGNNQSTTVFSYTGLAGWDALSGWATTDAVASNVMPTAGTIDELYVAISAAPGSGKTWTFFVFYNGSASAITCTITGTSATTCHDILDSQAVSLNDTVSMQVCPGTVSGGTCTATSNTGVSLKWGLRWRPTTAGQSVLLTSDTALFSNATSYSYINGIPGMGGTEANNQNIGASSFTIQDLVASISTVPGTGNSRIINLRSGGSNVGTPGNMTCTIGAAATTCTDTINSYGVSQSNLLDWQQTVTGSPATITSYKLSAVMTVP
jgi:hypothetical protein